MIRCALTTKVNVHPEFLMTALVNKCCRLQGILHSTAEQTRIFLTEQPSPGGSEQYLKDQYELKQEIKKSLGRISFTSDIHFCHRPHGPGSLEIAHRLLAFRVVQGSHDGDNIGQIIYDIVKEAGAHRKVISYHFVCFFHANHCRRWANGHWIMLETMVLLQ